MFSFLKSKPASSASFCKAAKAGKPAKPSKAPASGPPGFWRRSATRLALFMVGLSVIGAGLGLGTATGVEALQDWQARQPGCQLPVGMEAIDMNVDPWVPAAQVRAIKGSIANCLSPNPYDTQGLQAAARSVAGYPVVASVLSVVRGADGRVKVIVKWCEPAAVVIPTQDRPALVDLDGRVLLSDLQSPSITGMTILQIQGVTSTVPVGKAPWQDKDLKAALELLDFLRHELPVGSLQALRVAPTPAGPEMTLQLLSRGRVLEILWGLPKSAPDPSPEVRLRALATLLRDVRTYQSPVGSRFEVRTGVPMLRPPTEPPVTGVVAGAVAPRPR